MVKKRGFRRKPNNNSLCPKVKNSLDFTREKGENGLHFKTTAPIRQCRPDIAFYPRLKMR